MDKAGKTEAMTVMTASWKIRGTQRRQHAVISYTSTKAGGDLK